MSVDRCICTGRSFAELRDLASRNGWTLGQLQDATECGRGCGLCEHYVAVVLATGRTSLPLLTPEQARRIVEACSADRSNNDW